MTGKIRILGAVVADTTYRASRAPRMGDSFINFIISNSGANSNRKQSQPQDRSKNNIRVHSCYLHCVFS
ncbi:MAG: hypothetical protein IIC12_08740 [Proteobacteria bacterium]|nr:hypothetical protein [Pseudomonadota bacterium]